MKDKIFNIAYNVFEKHMFALFMIFGVIIPIVLANITVAHAQQAPQSVFYQFSPAQMKALPYITQERIKTAGTTTQEIVDGGPRYITGAAYDANEKYKRAVGACAASDLVCQDNAHAVFWKAISRMANEAGLPINDSLSGKGHQVCHASPNKRMFDLCYTTEQKNLEHQFSQYAGKLTDKDRRSSKVMEMLETPLVADQVCFDNQLCRYDQYAKGTAKLENYLKNRRQ